MTSVPTSPAGNFKWSLPNGEFKRQISSFRDNISDGPGAKFPPEAYETTKRLFAPCSKHWAASHRTLIVRALKGLEDIISVDTVHWQMLEEGWPFKDGYKDSLYGSEYIRDLYLKAEPEYSARFTVPVLWDKKTETIVNNESSDIIRILNTSFNKL
ncbi:S-glutathionyl-(chloro)hydroquinone reductase, partial [Dissophora globulifera]